MARSNKPILWLPFAAGGLVAALIIPVLILITGMLMPLGILPLPHEIAQFLPAAVGLLLIRKAAYRVRRIVVLHEHVQHVAGINRLDGRGGLAPLEIRAACEGNRDRLSLSPCRVGGAR